jgi:hypothetical protein
MKLIEINFPIFCIKEYEKIIIEEKITYIEIDEVKKVVDNKYLAGKTLGERRLKIPKDKRYGLKFSYLNYHQLLKSKCKVFIDNLGNVIKYKKHHRANLTYHRIVKIKQVENIGYVLYLEDINIPIEVPAIVYNYQNYVGLLQYNNGYLIYEFCDIKKSKTWRMI